jgi:hypothetical protein
VRIKFRLGVLLPVVAFASLMAASMIAEAVSRPPQQCIVSISSPTSVWP